MKMTVDMATGAATLTNIDNPAGPYNVDGIEIWSVSGQLNPTGWESIADAVVNRPLDVINGLGAGALSFGELAATTGNCAEATLSGMATFPAGTPWTIGTPVVATPGGTDTVTYTTEMVDGLTDLKFFYHTPTAGGDKMLGVLELQNVVVPEPATMSLLAFGGIGMLLRRKRNK
jgi:hypothetical protein